MTTENRLSESNDCAIEASDSIRQKAATLRLLMLTVGMQLMLRAMLLLRRWNY